MSERSFRRYRRRWEEEGLEGLFDCRLGKASARRVPVDRVEWVLEQYRTRRVGWTLKHLHDHLRDRHGFTLSYTWTKAVLQRRGCEQGAAARRAPRRAARPALSRRLPRPTPGSYTTARDTILDRRTDPPLRMAESR